MLVFSLLRWQPYGRPEQTSPLYMMHVWHCTVAISGRLHNFMLQCSTNTVPLCCLTHIYKIKMKCSTVAKMGVCWIFGKSSSTNCIHTVVPVQKAMHAIFAITTSTAWTSSLKGISGNFCMSTDLYKILNMHSLLPLIICAKRYDMTASHLVFLKMNFKDWLHVPDPWPWMYDILLATPCLWRQVTLRPQMTKLASRQRLTILVLTDVITGASLPLAADNALSLVLRELRQRIKSKQRSFSTNNVAEIIIEITAV